MPALPAGEFIGSVDVAPAIPSEQIMPFVEGFNLPLFIGLIIVSRLPGMGDVPSRVVRWNDVTFPDPVRAGGETDEFVPIDLSATSSEVAAVLKGVVTRIPDEPTASVQPPGMLPTGAIRELLRHAANFRDEEVLDLFLAATNITGTDATVFTGQQFRDCMNAFITQENTTGQTIFVGSHSAFADLRNDFAEVMAEAAKLAPQSLFSGTNNSFRGTIYDIDLWESGNVPVSGAGFGNGMLQIGGNVVIGGRIEEDLRVEVSRGDENQRRAATQYTMRWWDGYELFRQDGIRQCISR